MLHRLVALVPLAGLAVPGLAAEYLSGVKPVLAQHCVTCHAGEQAKGGLRLETAAALMRGGEHGPVVVPGEPDRSTLVRVIDGTHPDLPRMPYKREPLGAADRAAIRDWVAAGAPVPAREIPSRMTHWAFETPARPPLPAAGERPHPVDRWLAARWSQAGIEGSPRADRITLLRRVSLDLTGLPPTPAEVDAFLADTAPDAWERVVDRLLASPHYGERWGRWWLDGARYADSNGYSVDAPRSIWKYRDWVIGAFNRDLPYDQFVIEQLAGDLLPDATVAQRVATGFHRNTQINQEGGIDPEQFRIESVLDRVNTTATVFLGVTLACAQCHDHKFDPFTQRDYYQMFALFNNQDEPTLEIPGELEGGDAPARELAEASLDLERYLSTLGGELKAWESGLPAERRKELKGEVRKALAVPAAERSLKQRRVVFAAFKPADPGFKSREERVARLEKERGRPVSTMVLKERSQPRASVIFIKGDFTRPGSPVTPGTPAILPPLKSFSSSSSNGPLANRLDFARWLVATNQPLTARVLVNRVWQQYFGRGLVETENDFGTQGSRPSHPGLLDWLAWEFMAPSEAGGRAWSMKRLHRLLVTSAAYQQTARIRPDLRDIDPDNRLLARQSRLRLDGELIRDNALAVSGLLEPRLGGPPVFPPQPDGVMALGQSKRPWTASTGVSRFRRAVYTHWWRATPHPALAVFDAPDSFSACTRRLRSNTPLQALTLLNDQQYVEFAEGLVRRVWREIPAGDDARLERAFRLVLSRPPSGPERERLAALLSAERAAAGGQGELGGVNGAPAPVEFAAWTSVARALLNLDEAITRE